MIPKKSLGILAAVAIVLILVSTGFNMTGSIVVTPEKEILYVRYNGINYYVATVEGTIIISTPKEGWTPTSKITPLYSISITDEKLLPPAINRYFELISVRMQLLINNAVVTSKELSVPSTHYQSFSPTISSSAFGSTVDLFDLSEYSVPLSSTVKVRADIKIRSVHMVYPLRLPVEVDKIQTRYLGYSTFTIDQDTTPPPTVAGRLSAFTNSDTGAIVSISGPTTATSTSIVQTYLFNDIPVGDYTVTFVRSGYYTQTIDATVIAGTNTNVNAGDWTPTSAPPPVTDDVDQDGLPDDWENSYWGNLEQIATGDPDGDNRNNLVEYQEGTDPTIADGGDNPPPAEYIWTTEGYMAILVGIIAAAIIFAVAPVSPKIKGFVALVVVLLSIVAAHILNGGI